MSLLYDPEESSIVIDWSSTGMEKNMKTRKFIILFSLGVLGLLIFIGYAFSKEQVQLKDEDITNAVELELRMDEGISSHLIDVKTEDGVVTLSGWVDNILARDRAVKVGESIRGVRSVIDEIRVKAMDRPDSEIREDIMNALKLDPATDTFEIEVEVNKGAVTLSGIVDSYAERDLCGDVIKHVKGIKEFTNNIQISDEISLPDPQIKADIEQRLLFDILVNNPITVDVKDGYVTLSGIVGSAAEKSRAEMDAWVKGVSFVDIKALRVEPWARDTKHRDNLYSNLSDKEVKKAVKAALSYDPRVWAFEVYISVSKGEVILTGVVDSFKAKRSAEEDAMDTVGVWIVDNLLRVRPSAFMTETEIEEWNDADLTKNVRKVLSRNPYLERSRITVSVHNGKVYLYGSVDSFFEKYEAEDSVSRVKGVVEVENNLKIDKEPAIKTDWEIKRDIERQLFWNPFVDSDDITVSVKDGVATLTGSVYTWYELKDVMKNVMDGGAKWIINKLNVKHGPHDYTPRKGPDM
jgi:osmotically-inducible protein OsmY